LVVILIISLIWALVMPPVAASLPGAQLKSTARAVASSLRYARSKAVFESTPYIAIFDNTRKRLAVESVENPFEAAEMEDIRKLLDRSHLANVYEFPADIEFGVLNNNDADEYPEMFAIFFYPRGDSTGAKVFFKNLRRKQYTITVDSITGAVDMNGG